MKELGQQVVRKYATVIVLLGMLVAFFVVLGDGSTMAFSMIQYKADEDKLRGGGGGKNSRMEMKYEANGEDSNDKNHASKVSSATSGHIFTGEIIRKWDEKNDKSFNHRSSSVSPPPKTINDGKECINWAVVTTIFEPSEAVFRQARVTGWCLVVVADLKSPPEYDIKWSKFTSANETVSNFSPRVEYLTPQRQKELWFTSFLDVLPWNHFARKNVGYLYAIVNGAQRIWDFDDDNVLYWWIRTDLPDVPSLYNLVTHIDNGTALEVKDFTYRVFNPYPMLGGPKNSWPRGFPLQEIKNKESFVSENRTGVNFDELSLAKGQLGVVQSLANKQPDVDAVYRLTQPSIPFDFEKLPKHDLRPVLVPPHSLTPWNAQATLHLQSALWGILLPISVPGRVSDIWRSYIVQRICWDIDVRIGFASEPLVFQERNVHNIVGDMDSENQLYQQSNQLVDFLREWHSTASTLPERIEELWIALYERNYIHEVDVKMVKRWLRTLSAIKYNFPTIKRSGPPLGQQQAASVNKGDKQGKIAQPQPVSVPPDVPMSKCPGVPQLTIWTSDLHDGTRIDVPTMLVDLGMKVILGGIKKSQGPYPGVFKKEGVTVYNEDLGDVINKYKTHSTSLSDDDIRKNFEFWKDNPTMQNVDLYFCSFPSSMCEMWLPFNKSIAFVAGHRYSLGRCDVESRTKLDMRLKGMMQSTSPKHIFGALSKYDEQYLEYYFGTGPTSNLNVFRTYGTGFSYLWREAFDPGPPLTFSRTEILSITGSGVKPPGSLPSGVSDLRSIYRRYSGADLQQHPGIVLWAYSVESYKLIDFYALAVPLYIPSLQFYRAHGFGHDRSYLWSKFYCRSQTSDSSFPKHPSSSHPLSPESQMSSKEDEQYWLQFSDFYTWPHITYFDDLEDLARKVKQNDPVVIRKDMMNENLKRLLDFRQQMCEALVGVEVNRKTPSEFDPSFITT